MSKPIIVVQGGQWGSEAKGAVAASLCITRNVDFAVRTGAINAGHTVVYDGQKYAMQQLPTGWVNPNTKLVIGAGAYIHPDTLWREIDMVNRAMPGQDVRHRLYIDVKCSLHAPSAEESSKAANRHHAIGATGKGCSEAIVEKISKRNNGYQLFWDSKFGREFRVRNEQVMFLNTVNLLNNAYDHNKQLLIEGTQGTLLDLHLGPYPFTTSRMTTAANWVAEAGLSPALDYEVVLVCRTYPIRVAGNSGPMSHEMEWLKLAYTINDKLAMDKQPPLVSENALSKFELALTEAASSAMETGKYTMPKVGVAQRLGINLSEWSPAMRSMYRVAASELHRDALNLLDNDTVEELKKLFEMTTVTKKLRRLAGMSIDDLKWSVQVNRPAWICFTFMDYMEPTLKNFAIGGTGITAAHISALRRVNEWCGSMSLTLRTPVKMVTFGPGMEHAMNNEWLMEAASGSA